MVRGVRRGEAPATACFEVPLEPAVGSAVHRALEPEAEQGPEGSRIALRLDDGVLRIDIEADDVSTLRAAMHSMLRLLDTATQVARGRGAHEA